MKVSQILNNNVVLVKRGGNDVIVVSKGIGVRKKKGQEVKYNEIEKLYILDSYDLLDHFSYLLARSDSEDIILVQNIISYGEEKLGLKLNDSLALTLLDHLSAVFKRAKKGYFIKSPLIWDIKRFYPQYYEVGLGALQIIRNQKGVDLPDDEAVALALHFINVQEVRGNEVSGVKEVRTISDIISIIELHFKLKLDENSINYMRLFTHLQCFVQRICEGQFHEVNEDSIDLYKQVSKSYPSEFQCVQKIKVYIKSQFDNDISIEEEIYLMIHIHRVTERMEDKI